MSSSDTPGFNAAQTLQPPTSLESFLNAARALRAHPGGHAPPVPPGGSGQPVAFGPGDLAEFAARSMDVGLGFLLFDVLVLQYFCVLNLLSGFGPKPGFQPDKCPRDSEPYTALAGIFSRECSLLHEKSRYRLSTWEFPFFPQRSWPWYYVTPAAFPTGIPCLTASPSLCPRRRTRTRSDWPRPVSPTFATSSPMSWSEGKKDGPPTRDFSSPSCHCLDPPENAPAGNHHCPQGHRKAGPRTLGQGRGGRWQLLRRPH